MRRLILLIKQLSSHDRRIPPRQFTYSSIWYNALIAPTLVSFLETVEASGTPCVLVCDETYLKNSLLRRDQLPTWISGVIHVPVLLGEGHPDSQNTAGVFAEIQASGSRLPRGGRIHLLFASELGSALITLMTRANRANTYVDVEKKERKFCSARKVHHSAATAIGSP